MHLLRAFLIALLASAWTGASFAAEPTVGAPLPELSIEDRGELVAEGDDFDFQPWTSAESPGKVHVIQYFGATMGDRDLFKPVTDRIEKEFEPGSVHVTTVLNMDAAMWGTSGMVISELKKNKRQYPSATMVVDEEGSGTDTWNLGKDGTGLIVLDPAGTVRYFNRGPLDEADVASTIELIRSNISG